MGLRDALIRFLHREKQGDKRFEAMQSDVKALQIDNFPSDTYQLTQPATIGLQKDSLELGVAAGYTGRTLRDIDSSLNRIELQMATKDWVSAQFQGTLSLLVDMQKISQNNIENIRKTLENIENILKNIKNHQIGQKSEEKNELTAKMREVLIILKEVKEISYEDLARRLNVSISSLRGLLSIVARRTEGIKRFERDNKGWVSYAQDDSKRFESDSQSFQQQF